MAKPQKSERMNLLADLAKGKEEKASELLREARRRLDQAQDQLDGLVDYRSNALKPERTMPISNALLLTASQNFLSQMEQAIEQQQAVVAREYEYYTRVLGHWVEMREKHKTLSNLAHRALSEEQALSDKKEEQRQIDDFIAAKYRRS